jgi:hypothetical protein
LVSQAVDSTASQTTGEKRSATTKKSTTSDDVFRSTSVDV